MTAWIRAVVGSCGELVIYSLIRIFGRRHALPDVPWLLGPLGGATIGDRPYEEIARAEQLSIERLATPGRILLDKTGTITESRVALEAWHGPEWVKPLVLALEEESSHPIADAVRRAFTGMPSPAAADAPLIASALACCPASAFSTFVNRMACVVAPVRPTRADWITPPLMSSAAATPTMA